MEVIVAVTMRSSGFWGIMLCSRMKVNDVSENHIACISKMEGKDKQDTGVKQRASRILTFDLGDGGVMRGRMSADFRHTALR